MPSCVPQATDAAKGMLYLHSRRLPIVHRDLKSPNLLVDKHWRVKVRNLKVACTHLLTARAALA